MEIDILILDKKASVLMSAELSGQVPRNREVLSTLVLVGTFVDETQSSVVKARLTALGDQDPDLLSSVLSNQTSSANSIGGR